MGDWISDHKDGIQFVILSVVGVFLIVAGSGVFAEPEPGLLALGAGALGLPGYQRAMKRNGNGRDEEDDG